MANVGAVVRGLLVAIATAWALAGCAAADADEFEEGQELSEVQSTEYSTARWLPANPGNYSAGRSSSVQYIVVHDVEGTYAGAVSWFRNASANVSAHYVVRSSDGAITQMVRDANTAWHAGSSWMNARSIGIEHEGYLTDPDRWYTDAMYRASAKLVAHLARKFNIPIDRNHIVGHYQVVRGGTSVCSGANSYTYCLNNNNDAHSDPGAGWDWDRYMRYVREYAGVSANNCGSYANFTYWNCLPNSRERVRCVNGELERQTCSTECQVRPVGQDDVCAAVTNIGACGTRSGLTLWNCQSDGRTMLKCWNGSLYRSVCSEGCTVRALGVDDTCN